MNRLARWVNREGGRGPVVLLSLFLVLSSIAGALVVSSFYYTPPANPSHPIQPPSSFTGSTIGLDSGSTGTSCVDVTHCSVSLAAAANSVLTVGTALYCDPPSSACAGTISVAVHGLTATDIETTGTSGSSAVPPTQMWGILVTTAATETVYVNSSVAQYYAFSAADFTNTVITSTYWSGTGTGHGTNSTAECSVTTTVANEVVIDEVGVYTTAESTMTPGQSGTALTKEATTTDVVTEQNQYVAYSTAKTAFFSTALAASATTGWTTSCYGLEPALAPPAPTSLSENVCVVGITCVGTSTTAVGMTWTNPTGPLSGNYIEEATWSGSACGTYTSSAEQAVETSYTWTGLSSGEEYCFAVAAANTSVGEGSFSTAVQMSTLTTAPTGVTEGTVTATTAALSWTDETTTPTTGVVTNHDYEQASGSCGTFSGATATGSTSASYTVTGLSGASTYCYLIYTVTLGGASAASTELSGVVTLPAAPTALAEVSGSPTTTTAVGLTWTNPSTGSGVSLTGNYILEASYATGSCGSYTTSSEQSVETSYTWSSLTTGQAYCFEVEAVDSAGTSAASTAITNAPTISAAPTGLTQITADDTTTAVELSWTNPTTSPSSGVLTTNGGSDWAAVASCSGGATSTNSFSAVETSDLWSGLTSGEEYSWEVTATDAGGTSAGSNCYTSAAITAAPTSLTLGTTTSTSAALSWTAPTTDPSSGVITSYTVLYATYSGSCGSYSSITGVSGSPYTVTGLTGDDAYCFEVEALDAGGTSAVSNTLSNELINPAAPTNGVASPQAGSTTQLNLNWTQTVGTGTILNLTLARTSVTSNTCNAFTSGEGAVWVNIADSTAVTYVATSLSGGTSYCYMVTEWNSAGIGSWSATFIGTTYAAPAAPTGLSETADTSYTVSLAWTNPSGTLFNDTMLEGTSCGTWLTQTSTGGSATSGTVYNLQPYTSYCFAVEAWSGAGSSAASSTVTVVTPAGVPGAPTALQPTAEAATSVTLLWTNPVAQSGSEINETVYWGTSCGAISGGGIGTWTSDASLGGTATTHKVTGLSSLTSYCFSVALWTQAGQGSQAATVSASTLNPVLSAPTSLTYVSAGQTTVSLSWSQTATYPILNDTIAYSTTSACGGTLTYVNEEGPTTSATVSSLTHATTYYWEVEVWDNGGSSAFSSCITGATEGATPPMPYDVVAQTVGSTSVYITWVNPSGYMLIDNYVNVSTAADVCGTWGQVNNLGEVTTSYDITGLTAGDTYCIQVTAVDHGSPFSVALYVTLLNPSVGPSVLSVVLSMPALALLLASNSPGHLQRWTPTRTSVATTTSTQPVSRRFDK